MTFVNIAVAVSALAGGGGQKRFRTETAIFQPSRNPGGVFVVFGRFFGCLNLRTHRNGILSHFESFWVILVKILMEFWEKTFWQVSGHGKTTKSEKTL